MPVIFRDHDSSKSRPSKCFLILGMFIVFILLTFLFSSKSRLFNREYPSLICSSNRFIDGHLSSKQSLSNRDECHWYFLNYTPSIWESFWYENIKTLQEDVCVNLAKDEHLNKTIVLMQRLISLQKSGRNLSIVGHEESDQLLSRMFYRQRCFNSQTNQFYDAGEISQFIEPLIGLLRDPFTVCSRLDASKVPSTLYEGAILLSRRFLLLSVAAPLATTNSIVSFQSDLYTRKILPWMYDRSRKESFSFESEQQNKRIILLDLGSSYFGKQDEDISDTSTRWLYEHYRNFGLQFDRIIAYEAAPLDAKTAWEQLPEDVFPVYSFINTGCTASGILNPWKTLKRLARKEDHVIVKVDIDTFDLENLLMNEALNDSSIYSLIDELFFEHHVSVKEMLAYWRPPPGSLRDSYILFTKLRQLGIRMHSWP